MNGEASGHEGMETLHAPKPPLYPPVVVVDPSVGVDPPLSSGLLSQAATNKTSDTTSAPIASRDLCSVIASSFLHRNGGCAPL